MVFRLTFSRLDIYVSRISRLERIVRETGTKSQTRPTWLWDPLQTAQLRCATNPAPQEGDHEHISKRSDVSVGLVEK
jgi:hypothetical protein